MNSAPLRCFLGVSADDLKLTETLNAWCVLARAQQPQWRWIPPEYRHLTLVFLGAQPPASIAALMDQIDAITLKGGTLTPTAVTAFPDASSAILALELAADDALQQLQASLAEKARRVGMQIETRAWRPHVTLARHAPSVPGLHTLTLPPRCAVNRMTLWQSFTTPEGSRYEALRQWPVDL